MLTNAVFLKLFKDYLPLVLNVLVLIRHPCVLIVSGIKRPSVNPTSLRADSQWIMILKTFELVTLSFSQFHAQRNWLLPHALHIFNQYMRLPCCFWSLMLVRKIQNSFFTVCFVRRVIHRQQPHTWLRSKRLDPSQISTDLYGVIRA